LLTNVGNEVDNICLLKALLKNNVEIERQPHTAAFIVSYMNIVNYHIRGITPNIEHVKIINSTSVSFATLEV